MKDRTDMEDILKRSPLKENPFGVPKDYFETMRQEVMETISQIPVAAPYSEEKAEPATLLTYLKLALGLAAVFAIVFGMGYGVMALTGVSGEGISSVELQAKSSPAEMIQENTGTELTEEEVISIIGSSIEELFAQESTDSQTDIAPVAINGETIEQYLIDNRVTTTALALLE